MTSGDVIVDIGMTSLPVYAHTVCDTRVSMSKIRFFRDSNPESKYGLRFESESESESFLGALQQSQSFYKPFRFIIITHQYYEFSKGHTQYGAQTFHFSISDKNVGLFCGRSGKGQSYS